MEPAAEDAIQHRPIGEDDGPVLRLRRDCSLPAAVDGEILREEEKLDASIPNCEREDGACPFVTISILLTSFFLSIKKIYSLSVVLG